MQITSSYPVLATADVAAARAWWERHLGFTAQYVSDWYVHLGHPAGVALALVHHAHETIPPSGRTAARGVLVSFEVEDVDEAWARLRALGAEVAVPLRDEPFGQRHFILRGPDGVLVDVIKPIPPSAEYAAAYLGGAPA